MSDPEIVRFRPIQKEAQAVLVTETNLVPVADWCNGFICYTNLRNRTDRFAKVCIPHVDGYIFVPVGEWVVKLDDGEFVRMTHDTLYKHFEKIEETRVR